MNMKVCLFLMCLNGFALGAKILGIIPSPSYSHQIVFWPLWKELSLKGHQVTVITTDPMNNHELVNLTEINIHSVYKMWEEWNLFQVFDKPMWMFLFEYIDIGVVLMDKILSDTNVQKLIQDKSAEFDLVMIEAFHTAAYAFAPHFKCPLILLSSLDGYFFAYNEIGNPSHPVLHPDFTVPYKINLTFFQRLSSWFNNLVVKFYYSMWYIPKHQKLITKHFGDGYPQIRDIFKNYSMYFVNTNLIVHSIRPLLPNIISIGGGTHLISRNPLSDKLQKVLDNAKNGFLYFSLGSNVKSKDLTNDTKTAILDTFKELPYTVLWKFENEDLTNIPKNIFISKWFPQQEVLKHPNLKLFITQGGLQSLEEAIFNYVPIVGIPVMGDQMANIASIVSKGLGASLDYRYINKNNFKSTILEVINNSSYRAKVKEMAEYIKDQPDTGLNRAVWWTEYVIRHKGAPHLRNPALDLPLYQLYLLDITAFLVICLLVGYCVLRILLKLFISISRTIKSFLKKKEKQT